MTTSFRMTARCRATLRVLVPALALLSVGAEVAATTITQNASWTVNRSATLTKYRVVAYGDSIYAGYNTSVTGVAKYSAPTVQAEYLSAQWKADIESIRRTKSGAVAKDIYDNKIVAEKSYMQASSTRVVAFEMCGNDGLQSKADFKNQTGTCSYAKLDEALPANGFGEVEALQPLLGRGFPVRRGVRDRGLECFVQHL